MIQILILAAVAAFLFWRLSLVLGVRTGFEKTLDLKIQGRSKPTNVEADTKNNVQVDEDISDYVELESEPGQIFKEIKSFDRSFSVQNFVSGAKGAYEIILMAFENGDLQILEEHLASDVFHDFKKVVTDRVKNGLVVDASFGGLREIRIRSASFDKETLTAEITVFFKCEMTSVVKDKNNKIVEGSSSKVKTHTDIWTFGRIVSSDDPSWKLIATTGE